MKKRLEKGLVITQLVISVILLLAISCVWIKMHVYGKVFSMVEIYYANIYAAVPVGIFLIISILLLVKLGKRK